jgi:hypothetical protein
VSDIQVRLCALWLALMFTYQLGDILRLYAGDVVPGTLGGLAPQWLTAAWMGIAVLMLIPIVMIVASVMVTGQQLRWATVVAASGLFLFNLAGLPTCPGLYDKFLIAVSLVLNRATAWYAWSSLA